MKIAQIEAKLINHCGDDLSIVNAARVSFEKESDWDYSGVDEETGHRGYEELKQSDAKLIAYLAKHKHFSPFNHAFMSFRVKAPIFVARQLVKHKFMPWNEVSRRYVDSEPEFFFPEYWREKAANVKQGSGENRATKMYHEEDVEGWGFTPNGEFFVQQVIEDSLYNYNMMLKMDVCPEQARMVLPLNTMTEWIWSGTLGAFADMLKLRLDPHTQKESRDVANLIYEQALPIFPVSLKALLENK